MCHNNVLKLRHHTPANNQIWILNEKYNHLSKTIVLVTALLAFEAMKTIHWSKRNQLTQNFGKFCLSLNFRGLLLPTEVSQIKITGFISAVLNLRILLWKLLILSQIIFYKSYNNNNISHLKIKYCKKSDVIKCLQLLLIGPFRKTTSVLLVVTYHRKILVKLNMG